MEAKEEKEVKTDSNSRIGITVGLIDSLISISRVLAPRLRVKGRELPKAVLEALDDLYEDPDLLYILTTGNFNKHIKLNADDPVFKFTQELSAKINEIKESKS